MTLQQKQAIFAQNVARLIDHIFATGFTCSLGEVLRTAEQAELYAKEGKGIADSQHCKKLAIDIQFFDSNGKYLSEPEHYVEAGKYWESLHQDNRSGMHFKRVDANHFEMIG